MQFAFDFWSIEFFDLSMHRILCVGCFVQHFFCSTLRFAPSFVRAPYWSIAMVSNPDVAVASVCWWCNPTSLASLSLARLGWIVFVEVIDNLLWMLEPWRIVPLPILIISLLFHTKLDLPTYSLSSSFPSGIQYVIDFLLFFVVDYNGRGRVIVLTR